MSFSGSGILPVICHLSGTLEQFLSDVDGAATNDLCPQQWKPVCHGDSLLHCSSHCHGCSHRCIIHLRANML